MIARRSVLAGLALLPANTAWTQTPGKVYRVGVLQWSAFHGSYFDQLFSELQELGYVRGRNLTIEFRSAEDRAERAAAGAAELVEIKVDAIVALATGAAVAAKAATQTIPIVMNVADPQASGLVKNLARPEANLTGVSIGAFEIMSKRLQLAAELMPGLTRVAFLTQTGEPNAERFLATLHAAGDKLGITVFPIGMRDPDELQAAFARARGDGAQAIITQPIFNPLGAELGAAGLRHHLPTIGEHRVIAEHGGLMSYGVDRNYLWHRLALMLDRVLQGARPRELPVEMSVRTVMVINLRTAQQLGLAVPHALLARADEVIE